MSKPKGCAITILRAMSQLKLGSKATGFAALETAGKHSATMKNIIMLSARVNLEFAVADHRCRWSRMVTLNADAFANTTAL
jgi:hypothetical protein